jgi:hypothetical protein
MIFLRNAPISLRKNSLTASPVSPEIGKVPLAKMTKMNFGIYQPRRRVRFNCLTIGEATREKTR